MWIYYVINLSSGMWIYYIKDVDILSTLETSLKWLTVVMPLPDIEILARD